MRCCKVWCQQRCIAQLHRRVFTLYQLAESLKSQKAARSSTKLIRRQVRPTQPIFVCFSVLRSLWRTLVEYESPNLVQVSCTWIVFYSAQLCTPTTTASSPRPSATTEMLWYVPLLHLPLTAARRELMAVALSPLVPIQHELSDHRATRCATSCFCSDVSLLQRVFAAYRCHVSGASACTPSPSDRTRAKPWRSISLLVLGYQTYH